jgi:quinol monooxygenase YgiN
MITRIVKLTFKEEEVDNFMDLFHEVKDKIRASAGCTDLQLLRDTSMHNVLFTVSQWDSEAHLDQYRNSELFNAVWPDTKIKFSGKPEAWSMEQLVGSFNNKSL